MRAYQEIGLKSEAVAYLEKEARQVPTMLCPHCGGVVSTGMDAEVYEEHDSFYDAGPHLRRIVLKDGSVVREIIQVEPWSSGPMAFLCLETDTGEWLFPWTGREMNQIEEGLAEDTDEVVGSKGERHDE